MIGSEGSDEEAAGAGCCWSRGRRVAPNTADGVVTRWWISLRDRQFSQKIKLKVWAESELQRDEWMADLRKHAVTSDISNVYEVHTDKHSKLGFGSFSTVWKATDRATGQV